MDTQNTVESIAVRKGQKTDAWYRGAAMLDSRIDVSDALHNAGFSFRYEADELFYNSRYPEASGQRQSRYSKAIMRVNADGTTKELAGCGSVWTAKGHQPEDIIRFFQAVADRTQLQFEAAAVVDEGRGLFAIARLPTTHPQTLKGRNTPIGEEVHVYVAFAIYINRKTRIFTEATLPACWNSWRTYMYKRGVGDNRRQTLEYSHHSPLPIKYAIEAINNTDHFEGPMREAARMMEIRMNRHLVRDYYKTVLMANASIIYHVRKSLCSMEHFQRPAASDDNGWTDGKKAAFERDLATLENIYRDGDGQELDCRRNNMWGAFNGFINWTDHIKRSRGQRTINANNKPETVPGSEKLGRMYSLLHGPLAVLKASAHHYAMTLKSSGNSHYLTK
jgi:hypothetical protein